MKKTISSHAIHPACEDGLLFVVTIRRNALLQQIFHLGVRLQFIEPIRNLFIQFLGE
jgi:hypothetical protein